MVLVNGIDLNDGNMDMGKMKSVLDADVENIRNAKATVEKMIEEKMLGTEADGTIGVRLADGQINYHDKKGQEYIARNTALEFLKETEQVFLFSIVKMESSCRVEIIQITDTMRQENLKKSYIKEQINQLLQETNANGTKDYAYDHRGNLLSVTSGEEVLRAYGFDAANQMNSSMGMTDGQIKKAVYQYNGLGHRMEQSIAAGDAAPEQTIRYTLDVTRQYHNLLQKTENNVEQTYFWDGNVTGMEEEGREHFYFQDDLGSPMRLADEAGRSEETYGFDEFGNDIRTAKDIFKDSLQNFGFTGYQMDSAGGLYFAQARRYDAGVGRFVSEDFIKGHIAVPYTMNHYNYCWNRPMDLVDLNGMWPTAGVTSDLFGIHEKAAEMDDSDPVHSVSDWCSKGDNLKSAGELGKYSIDWWVQYATNKNLKNTLKTSQTAEEMAALEGISLGRYLRTTRARKIWKGRFIIHWQLLHWYH